MSKRKTKPAETPTAAPPAPSPQPAVAGPLDINSYAATLPRKRQALIERLQGIDNMRQQVIGEINELGGEAKAVAGMLGKTVEEVMGLVPALQAKPSA